MRAIAPALVTLTFLLAGCASDVVPARGQVVGSAHDEARHDGFPGVVIEGSVEEGDTMRLQAEARNEGDRTYRIQAICVPPWMDEVKDAAGRRVEAREPQAYCMAFGLGPFSPGDRIPFNATWDGQIRNPETGNLETAPAGDYTWSAVFEVFDEGEGPDFEERETLRLDFSVRWE